MADGKLDHIIIDTAIVTLYTRIDRNKNRMSIETDNVERVNHAAPKMHIPISDRNDQDRFEDPFQSKTLAAGSDCEGRLLELSYLAKERQREAPHAGHDDS